MPNFISLLKKLFKKEKHKKQLNDNEIHNKIGQLLFNIAPEDAKIVIMKVELSQENDHCKYKYNYINKFDDALWFTGGKANSEMLNLLVELKQYTIDNNLTNGHPIWVGCIVTIDIEKSKINIEFKYEPFIDEE
ncbi:hypothetical protein RCS94_11040 [Orbaceae bacterium ac157xtp]